jgi:hypothetical protein
MTDQPDGDDPTTYVEVDAEDLGIDEETWRAIEAKALEEGTTVEAFIVERLRQWSEEPDESP